MFGSGTLNENYINFILFNCKYITCMNQVRIHVFEMTKVKSYFEQTNYKILNLYEPGLNSCFFLWFRFEFMLFLVRKKWLLGMAAQVKILICFSNFIFNNWAWQCLHILGIVKKPAVDKKMIKGTEIPINVFLFLSYCQLFTASYRGICLRQTLIVFLQ